MTSDSSEVDAHLGPDGLYDPDIDSAHPVDDYFVDMRHITETALLTSTDTKNNARFRVKTTHGKFDRGRCLFESRRMM